MVVQEENDAHVEVAVIKKPKHLESRKYIFVRNHVREFMDNELNTSSNDENLVDISQHKPKKKKKNVNKDNKHDHSLSYDTNSERSLNKVTQISENDIKELKSVYEKCKSVIKKIELKYGHILNLDEVPGSSCHELKRKWENNTESENIECHCVINKKIVFDDDGKQSTKEPMHDIHICPMKINRLHQDNQLDKREVHIEYEDNEPLLPDDLISLGKMLQDPELELSLRHKAIDKIKAIKEERLIELRIHKQKLIEELKSNPDANLEFNGTNLSSIPGYL